MPDCNLELLILSVRKYISILEIITMSREMTYTRLMFTNLM